MAAALPSSFSPVSRPTGPNPTIPIVLRELGGSNRTLILVGSDLPREFGELEFGGRVRGKTTYYPGSKTPTSQILGPVEDPIRFGGELDDRLFGGPPGHAYRVMLLLDSMRKSGAPVSIEYGPFFRRCRWLEASFVLKRLDHIPYRIELEVVDAGQGTRLRLITDVLGLPDTDGLTSILDGIDSALSGLPV